ncbi:GNAT family N-acetyltransferase [Listeria sp. FSL L7-0091]|uniref:GNAT family N-acetyltransferase n=1 Tax=Listeria farberi TaxID=2713500 RepID=UPI001629E6BA|nr:GNAT family protein [Listeria farberi]MBC2262711.1 GNAT family N-acetyltransferase [Listeria farberi]
MELSLWNPSFQASIENYFLEDLTYTALPKDVLQNMPKTYFPVLCFEKKQVVCFFVLDQGRDKFKYTKNVNSLLLRAFSTNSAETRKGYATLALKLLPSFTKNHFPSVTNIILGVNKKNQPAIHLYEKAGFKNTNRTFLGPKGPQKILALSI